MNIGDKPLVSICVPVYNGGKYLDECLKSILNQSYPNWECIVNNNCSKDNSLEIAQKYQSVDNRFKVFTNDSFISLVLNWNMAFSHSCKDAKYFKMVQADDWIYPECIEKMVALFESDETIGLCSSFRIDSSVILPRSFNVYTGSVFDGHEMLMKHLLHQFDLVGSITTVMFSMQHLRKLNRFPAIFDEKSYHIDSELDYEVMNLAKVGFVPQILTYTRRHNESGTSTVVFRNGTLFQHYEKILFEYQNLSPLIHAEYNKLRKEYAYFYLVKKFFNKRSAVDWHNQYLVRKFKTSEFVSGIVTCNPLTRIVEKMLNRIVRQVSQ